MVRFFLNFRGFLINDRKLLINSIHPFITVFIKFQFLKEFYYPIIHKLISFENASKNINKMRSFNL